MGFLNIMIQVLTVPAILIGIFAMFGLLLQKKTVNEVVLGTVKTILGFLILNIGISAILGSLGNFDQMFSEAFNISGVYLDDNIAVGAMMDTIGREVGLVMVLGFFVNILVARFTPAKWIYLSGHKVWHMAGGLAFVLLMFGAPGWAIVLIGALVLGTYMAVQPMIAQPWMRKVTGSDDFGLAHTMSSIVLISAFFGKLFGNPKKSVEELKMPSNLEFFRDMAVSFSLIMLLMFFVPALFMGYSNLTEMAGSQNPVVFIILQSLTAAGGILVVLQGVRMFIGELIPAFRGIAMKLVPGARPALDVPVVFPFAPTGVVIGLITCFIGWVVGMFIGGAVNLPIIAVPSMIGVMFGGTTAGVFGNALGGKRGTVIAGLASGLFWPIAAGLFYPLLDFAGYGITGTALLTPDIYFVVALVKGIGMLFGFGG